ncbi:hypothetical protein BDV18DRAFT_141334 [Aspergillus unguis]
MADKQNPVACGPCRQKKCKCDRTLPVCSQCSDPARCIYPESGKRGLPQGYITHLENRLAATEKALYSSYSHLRTSPQSFSITDITQPNTSRAAAVNEWSRLPLQNQEDLERWWSEKARVYGTVEGGAPSEWSPGTIGTIYREKDAHASSKLNSIGNSQMPIRPPARYPREGRAEQLVELEPAIYF